jgi:DNA-directed RNA polymerase sigma subunit (sigma70/sigma32)
MAKIYTYEEIATELGISVSGVRKIEQQALRKIKKELKWRGMTLDDMLPSDTHHDGETPWDTQE